MKTISRVAVRLFLAVGAMPALSLRAEPPDAAKRLIEHFHMQPVPQEGVWFSVAYVSSDAVPGSVLPARYHGKDHTAGSSIYDVMTREDFSALHKLQTDETWHFYGGDPIEMLLLYPDGHSETVVIGPDVFAGQQPQFTVPQGVWQGSAPVAAGPAGYSFVGNQLAPGFDYDDFEIGYRDELQTRYPSCAANIARLTRPEFARRPVGTPAASNDVPVAARVFNEEENKPIEVAPGILLRELVGRAATAKTDRYSVANFVLEKGISTPTSRNKLSGETFLVMRGRGQVTLDGNAQPVGPGSVVVIPSGVSHAIQASESDRLDFFAIEAPAFQPEDYVAEPPPQPTTK